jgi:hypothetical protein
VTFSTQLVHVSRVWDFNPSTSFICCLFFVLHVQLCLVFIYPCCFCMHLFSCVGSIIGTWLFSQHANQHLMYYYYYYYYYYSPLSPSCRMVTNNQMKQPAFLGNIVLELFCSYSSWHTYCYFRCYVFCTFTLLIFRCICVMPSMAFL